MARKSRKPASTVSATASSGVAESSPRGISRRASILRAASLGNINRALPFRLGGHRLRRKAVRPAHEQADLLHRGVARDHSPGEHADVRSEEHTSELQSLMRISYAVFCLNKNNTTHPHSHSNIKTQ